MGPWVTTADEADPGKPLHLMTRVNGEMRQDDTTERLIWDFAELIRYISMFTTLKPGDLILTGTPTGVGARTPIRRCGSSPATCWRSRCRRSACCGTR